MGFDIRKFFFRKPNIALEGGEDDASAFVPEKAAIKCEKCKTLILSDDLNANGKVCAKCGYHFKMGARERIKYIADEGEFEELFADVTAGNRLDFPDYDDKLEKARAASGENEAVVCGEAKIGGINAVCFAMEPKFMMGSMGAAAGEKGAVSFKPDFLHGHYQGARADEVFAFADEVFFGKNALPRLTGDVASGFLRIVVPQDVTITRAALYYTVSDTLNAQTEWHYQKAEVKNGTVLFDPHESCKHYYVSIKDCRGYYASSVVA